MSNESIIYVNLIVHSVSEAVRDKVTKKLQGTVIPNPIVEKVGELTSNVTSKKYVAKALSEIVSKQIPVELKKKGIDAKMEETFRENTFVVLELKLIHVDTLILASQWTEASLSWILESIGAANKKTFEEQYLPKVLAGILTTTIPKVIGDEMSAKKIDAETKVCKSDEQSVYFFSTLNNLREKYLEEKRMNRNPINKLRKSLSSQSSTGDSIQSLNSMYSVDGDDESTIDTRSSKGSRSSRGSICSSRSKKKSRFHRRSNSVI